MSQSLARHAPLLRPQEPLEGITRIYSDKLLEQIGQEPFPVAKIVEFNLQAVPDSEEAFPNDEALASQRTMLESAVGKLDSRRGVPGGVRGDAYRRDGMGAR